MISAWHLFWIVPLSASTGLFVLSLCFSAKGDGNFAEHDRDWYQLAADRNYQMFLIADEEMKAQKARAKKADGERDEALRDVQQLHDAAVETEGKLEALTDERDDYKAYYETMETPDINAVKYIAIRDLRDRIEARRAKEVAK